jgi:hypothetical protein
MICQSHPQLRALGGGGAGGGPCVCVCLCVCRVVGGGGVVRNTS